MAARKAKGRRARGTGSIFFHAGKGSWIGRVVIGRYPSGKPKYRECWGATQGEVVRKMAVAQPPGPETTVGQWAERWLATLTNRKQTSNTYRERLAHVLPVVGHLRVAAVTAADVELLYARLVKTLARSTAAVVLGVAGTMFRAAVRARLIPTNPVQEARRPRMTKVRRDVYAPADLARVVESANRYAGARPAALMAAIGCRIGEAIGLDVADYDRETGKLSITRTWVASLRTLNPPKSENGIRTITVPAVARPVVEAAIGTRKAGPLFSTRRNARVYPSTIDRGVRYVLRDLGLPVRGSHALRHSVATMLVSAGVPVGDVAKFLGDSVITIIRTYVHATTVDPAATIDRLFGGGS